jgi:DNA helicase II / ATP-dependent DNA helicase PcrA
MNTAAFDARYAKLNTAQKEAVDAIEGPVMVVAGPGTGKTEILTLRIANIIRRVDINPENILALTFTEAGATNMRRRLVDIIGAPAYRVTIQTFHGFCNSVIKDYPEEFPRIIGSESITEVDQVRAIEEVLTSQPFELLRPIGNPLHHVRGILSAINNLKREGVDPAEFTSLVSRAQTQFDETPDLYHEKGAHKGKMKGVYQKEQKRIEKNRELIRVYEGYEQYLRAHAEYDYSDMIMEVKRALSTNNNLLLMLQEQYQYILVDEHQDTNNAQNTIMQLLCNFHAHPNIFVVGDEKQAIFRFQGASLENFLFFKHLYPDAKLIVLTENYRSAQSILDSAHSLIAGKKELVARAGHENTPIKVCALSRPDVEHYFIARDIRATLDAGVRPEEIAVLCRNNRDATDLVPMLERAGVPYVIESDEHVMHDVDMRKIVTLLRAIDEFGSDVRIAEAMHIDFLELNPLDVYRVINAAHTHACAIYDILRSDTLLDSLHLQNAKKIRTWYGVMQAWAVAAKNHGVQEVFNRVMRESGFIESIMAHPEMVEKLEKLNGFFDEIQKLHARNAEARVHDLLEYLATIEQHKLLIKKSSFGATHGRVRLMTAHKSKGQEFEYVYIVNAYDGHWGNKVHAESVPLLSTVFSITHTHSFTHDPIDDERRLFYVSLTRAKKLVTISYAKESITGKEQLPCQFIEELRQELLSREDVQSIEDSFSKDISILFAPSRTIPVAPNDAALVKELFIARGISATALNNYLSCPWKYFYQNLLRIPSVKEPSQMFGTAIHATLDDVFSKVQAGTTPSRTYTLTQFQFHFDAQPFARAIRDEWRARGEKALGGYWDTYHSTWRPHVRHEFSIKGVALTPEIILSGKLDKIEILNERNEVNVVDYKTGAPKTRGEIEGMTASSNGDIKRQLVFYKLLLSRTKKEYGFTMVSADIDFVQPDEKGRYKKESFVITDEEVTLLTEEIMRVAHEILSLSFWNMRCEDEECEYCALREMMGAQLSK